MSRVGGRLWRHQKVPADGNKMKRGSDEDEAVPNGVSERYDAITFEEHDPYNIEGATGSQLNETGRLLLLTQMLNVKMSLIISMYGLHTTTNNTRTKR